MKVEFIKSLGKYQTHTVDKDDTIIGDYFAVYTKTETGSFRWSYSIMFSNNIMTNHDFTINGWIFNKVVTLRCSESFYDNYFNKFEIDCLTPNGDELCLSFSNILRAQKPVEAVFNTIYLISCCKNKQEAEILSRAFTFYPIVSDLSKNQEYIIDVSKNIQEANVSLEKLINENPKEDFLCFVKKILDLKIKCVNSDISQYCRP